MSVYFVKVQTPNCKARFINLVYVQDAFRTAEGHLRLMLGKGDYVDVVGESGDRLEALLNTMATDLVMADNPLDTGDGF